MGERSFPSMGTFGRSERILLGLDDSACRTDKKSGDRDRGNLPYLEIPSSYRSTGLRDHAKHVPESNIPWVRYR